MKKLLAFALAAMMLFGLAASGLAEGETVTLKVWGSQEDQELLGVLVENFKAANPDTTWDISLGVVGEPDAKARYLEDPAAAADVFAFSNDQLLDLVNADALYEVTRNLDAIVAANSAGSIESATLDGVLYGYPMTADNGYFLYYDKSVLSEEDVQTLDGILAKANEAGKKVFMDVSNGWYIASFFLGAGCTLGLDENGKQTCDFNNEAGVAAGEAIRAFTADPAFLTGDDSVLTGGMGDTICAGVSGTWNAAAIQEKLGENYAACKLPTFTLNGEQVQMSSFIGTKLIGVNTQTAHPVEAMMLAEFLTNEEAQQLRFEMREIGPSNSNVAASEEVQANIALAALAEQSQYGVSQKYVLGNFWTPSEAFGLAMENQSTDDMQSLLDSMVAQITG
ncbi:MAG TPA: extracellular solute-binding protein [Candidatus Ornithocaccomicrobium faecavium]|uniref:Extracellular solute-binding protein n=2 Tax=Clostridia incertae sedis TaxID=189325 RepID=A0A9D1G2U0_9FIRM|nr:extracellular solute-binding protein [Clostridiales bacterium]HIS93947.1 extracellular solute-binding protein [Candidatus Alectryocaccomicrobium excrementavium]HIV28598.1 extracellular solute-binding protein [Candidatus Ornithocaccomicrobium faecavium]